MSKPNDSSPNIRFATLLLWADAAASLKRGCHHWFQWQYDAGSEGSIKRISTPETIDELTELVHKQLKLKFQVYIVVESYYSEAVDHLLRSEFSDVHLVTREDSPATVNEYLCNPDSDAINLWKAICKGQEVHPRSTPDSKTLIAAYGSALDDWLCSIPAGALEESLRPAGATTGRLAPGLTKHSWLRYFSLVSPAVTFVPAASQRVPIFFTTLNAPPSITDNRIEHGIDRLSFSVDILSPGIDISTTDPGILEISDETGMEPLMIEVIHKATIEEPVDCLRFLRAAQAPRWLLGWFLAGQLDYYHALKVPHWLLPLLGESKTLITPFIEWWQTHTESAVFAGAAFEHKNEAGSPGAGLAILELKAAHQELLQVPVPTESRVVSLHSCALSGDKTETQELHIMNDGIEQIHKLPDWVAEVIEVEIKRDELRLMCNTI